MTIWFAHSDPRARQEDWHALRDHLQCVGERAGDAAAKFEAGDMGQVAGLLHDLGKYSSAFQARLRGEGGRVDHSTAGAIVAAERYRVGMVPIGRIIAAAIAGHHAGLADGNGSGKRLPLEDRLKQAFGVDLPALDPAWDSEIVLPATLSTPPFRKHPDARRCGFQLAFFVRMLFSCLVDADYLDTERWFAAVKGSAPSRGASPDLVQLKAALDEHLSAKQRQAPASAVNAARADVLAASRAAAALKPGLFSLTVPTGGGKTLSGLAFALDHAVREGLDRVIYVAPFTSIIEQNAQAYRDALVPHGNCVLEHHSAFSDEEVLRERRGRPGERGPEAIEKLRLAMENWDAPVIATTAVQFFESLFSATPSRCRKLHNIARSVVILDEAQTLPLDLLRPCIAAIDELSRNYGASIVLCTATQPAIEEHPEDLARSFLGGLRDVRPVVPKNLRDRLFRELKRVQVNRHPDELDDEALASMLRGREQVLCIVNSRGHAGAMFERLREEPGIRHLSTWMCAAHRAKVLAQVREDLATGRPCRVISTSLVEAGVDLDFPSVFRAEAGLDSIAQAAGRCNREGRQKLSESVVVVFRPKDWEPPAEVEQFGSAMRSVFRQLGDGAEVLAPDAIDAYFRELYWRKSAGRDDELDKHDIIARTNERAGDFLFPFEWVENTFRIIRDAQQPIIVSYDDYARDQLKRLRHAERVGGIARKLQRYVVPVHRGIFLKLRAAGAVAPAREGVEGRQFYALVNDSLYDEDVGLRWNDPVFVGVEKLLM